MRKFKFCFDLDGTICYTKTVDETYEEVKPIPGAIETLQYLHSQGHYIIILTARNMVTHNNNMGKIIANQCPIVMEWLKKHNIPYDELHFGKPVADFYVDDKGIKFENWNDIKKLGE
jgi:capsule biosynthesis phosphatase